MCLFFKEKYDPGKIPVLFVHGAVGTPLGWENIVGHMDLDRFQPWFYYYPWNGHRMSEKGVWQAPQAVPSWYDMVPDSEFIKSLTARRCCRRSTG